MPDSPVLPTAVGFDLALEQHWFGKIRGRVQDDPDKGAPQPGVVEGRVFGSRVKFRKWLPEFLVFSEERVITLGEFFRREYDTPLDEDLLPPPIWYRGRYDPLSQRVEGNWEMAPVVFKIVSRGVPFECPFPLVTGTWEMARSA
jgi:hypothetical protein